MSSGSDLNKPNSETDSSGLQHVDSSHLNSSTSLNLEHPSSSLNTSKRFIEADSLIEMSKLSKSDLATITEKHMMLANTLVKVHHQLESANWETWKVEFEILMRNVRLDTIILKEWDEDAKRDPLFAQFNKGQANPFIVPLPACVPLALDLSTETNYSIVNTTL